jgi:murein DD-endopeptidase MepM/ murein hydrolase activator NlpD
LAIAALEKVFDPRRLQVGQEILITLQPTDSGQDRLLSVTLPLSAEREVAAVRAEDGSFVPDEINRPLHRALVRVEGDINGSLFLATARAGVPLQIVMDAIRIFSWEVDFQRDIQKGDRFQFLFERFFSESGEAVKDGKVVFASLLLSGKDLRLYRHTREDGSVEYFDPNGQSARRTLLRTPVDGARLSSGFGRRKHPILGYTRIHRGIDFAAPTNTPIVAAGDGVIEYAGRNGAYGRYVRIRHNGTYKTAYAHMRRIAKGVRSGARVKQGQVIGYVGSSGRSTGPHLHYEVMTGGKQINPMKLRLPTGDVLEGGALDQFDLRRAEIDSLFAGTPALYQTAGN